MALGTKSRGTTQIHLSLARKIFARTSKLYTLWLTANPGLYYFDIYCNVRISTCHFAKPIQRWVHKRTMAKFAPFLSSLNIVTLLLLILILIFW